MNIRKSGIFAATLMAMSLFQPAALAEDIDIFGNPVNSNDLPNVLVIIDNSANWSAASQHWPGGIKQGQAELNALKSVLNEIDDGLRVGLMLFTEGTNANNPNGPGGYVRYAVRRMTSTNKNALQELIGSASCVDGNNSLTGSPNCIYKNFDTPTEKVGTSKADYSAVMFEAFKYYGGYTSPAHALDNVAGTPTDSSHFGPLRYSGSPDPKSDTAAFTDAGKSTYLPPTGSGCAKNYIIFIGNGFPTQDSPASLLSGIGGDTSQLLLDNYTTTTTSTTSTLTTTTCGAYGNCTAALAAIQPLYPGYSSYACSQANCAGGKQHTITGTSTVTTSTPTGTSSAPTASNSRYPDEWARYLNQTDVSSTIGKQNVFTYTIDVYKDAQDANESALLRSMAKAGGGKYYVAQDAAAILDALRRIFSEIQATNSVFASSSLPVSVNTQGTYLNQIFVGMFRPDGSGQPRWNGNLKQYQFALSGSQLIFADQHGHNAVSTSSGFIDACAESFWSSDSGTYWNFPSSNAKGSCTAVTSNYPTPGSSSFYSDVPDGDLVEKGGAAQRLRGEGSWSGSLVSGTTNYSTRNTLTCNGSSTTSCTALIAFNTSNTGLTQDQVDWMKGKDLYDENANSVTAEMRPSAHGDVVHSQPAAVDYGGGNGVVVFYGGNDGFFRAVNGNKTATSGNELWSFIAPETFGRIPRLMSNSPLVNLPGINPAIVPTPTRKDYFFDGSVSSYRSGSTAWIYATMRRGGRAIYAFNVSDPANPVLKWRVGCFTNSTTDSSACTGGWGEIGQTWSKPQIGYLSGYVDASSNPKPVLIFGGGYDTCEDTNAQVRCGTSPRKGANIWFVDADTGSIIRTYPTNYSVPGDVKLVTDAATNYVTNVYAGDTGGYVYRINVGTYNGTAFGGSWTSNASASNIAIANMGGTNQAKKFLNGPDVVETATYNAVLIGTGDREHPLYEDYPCATGVQNQFYMIKDTPVAYPASPVTPTDLTDVSSNASATAADINSRGWVFNLASCEQTVNMAVTIGGSTFFSTNQATETDPATCSSNLGTARGYAVKPTSGAAVSSTGARYAEFVNKGLPPSPVAGVVNINGVMVPFVLGAAIPGESAAGGTFSSIKVNINPHGRRNRTFWYGKGR